MQGNGAPGSKEPQASAAAGINESQFGSKVAGVA